MRDKWLSNRVFKSYDDLVDHCFETWNKLVDQTQAHQGREIANDWACPICHEFYHHMQITQ